MLKKTIAALLSLIMIISCLSVTALAADNGAMIGSSDIKAMAEQLTKKFIDEQKDAASRLGELFMSNPIVGGVAEKLYGYAVAKVGTPELNAYGSYEVVPYEGTNTVNIAVDIAKHLDLYRLDHFYKAVNELVDGQKSLNGVTKDSKLMDYNRVAGELVMHMAAYSVTAPINYVMGKYTPSVITTIYNEAKVADINIGEDRVPESVMRLVGGMTKVLYQVSYGWTCDK